jgi:tetratricopeptide (TPR) repeat protein
LLSDFYATVGNGEESVNFMKEALSKCIRVCGAQSRVAGGKYY